MMKFRLGDTIKVTLGKDKGREGKVEKLNPSKLTVVVSGLNLYKKHVKSLGNQKGGIYNLPRPYSFGKIALLCPKCKKQTRVGLKLVESEKVRVCRKCGKEIDTK